MMTQVKNIPLLSTIIMIVIGLTSCSFQEQISTVLSESEAAELIEASLDTQAGDITTNLQDMTEQLVQAVLSGDLCDTLYTDTLANDYQGSRLQASYSSQISYQMTCTILNIPQTASFSSSTESIFTTQRIRSDNDADFVGDASGLELSASALTFNGTYIKTGIQDLNIAGQKTIKSTLTADILNINVNKISLEIESGSLPFTFSGSTDDENFSHTGMINFHGNQTATLTLNGTDYTLDWNE